MHSVAQTKAPGSTAAAWSRMRGFELDPHLALVTPSSSIWRTTSPPRFSLSFAKRCVERSWCTWHRGDEFADRPRGVNGALRHSPFSSSSLAAMAAAAASFRAIRRAFLRAGDSDRCLQNLSSSKSSFSAYSSRRLRHCAHCWSCCMKLPLFRAANPSACGLRSSMYGWTSGTLCSGSSRYAFDSMSAAMRRRLTMRNRLAFKASSIGAGLHHCALRVRGVRGWLGARWVSSPRRYRRIACSKRLRDEVPARKSGSAPSASITSNASPGGRCKPILPNKVARSPAVRTSSPRAPLGWYKPLRRIVPSVKISRSQNQSRWAKHATRGSSPRVYTGGGSQSRGAAAAGVTERDRGPGSAGGGEADRRDLSWCCMAGSARGVSVRAFDAPRLPAELSAAPRGVKGRLAASPSPAPCRICTRATAPVCRPLTSKSRHARP
mmetsp:Transcript_96223/g.294317  ORF Transcript_96223/g.294317 Transcript_96223/m.294317 type:complete len:436 (-) Transcript_96223:466-1773(-)